MTRFCQSIRTPGANSPAEPCGAGAAFGGPGVWVVCMLFFQLLLLGGYTYAHLSTRWLRVDRSAALHVGVLVLAVSG